MTGVGGRPYDGGVLAMGPSVSGASRAVMGNPKKIDVSSVLAAGRELEIDGRVELASFGGWSFSAPAVVAIVVRRLDRGLELRGTIDARYAGLCDRCLEDVEKPLQIEVAEQFAPGSDPFGAGNVLAGDELDVGDLVRQLIDAAFPMITLCRDECRGLCPSCGRSRNGDACDCAPSME